MQNGEKSQIYDKENRHRAGHDNPQHHPHNQHFVGGFGAYPATSTNNQPSSSTGHRAVHGPTTNLLSSRPEDILATAANTAGIRGVSAEQRQPVVQLQSNSGPHAFNAQPSFSRGPDRRLFGLRPPDNWVPSCQWSHKLTCLVNSLCGGSLREYVQARPALLSEMYVKVY